MINDSDDVITASTISPAAMPTIFCLMDLRNMPQGPNRKRRRMTTFCAARKPFVAPASGVADMVHGGFCGTGDAVMYACDRQQAHHGTVRGRRGSPRRQP